jgi:hypothetical protein
MPSNAQKVNEYLDNALLQLGAESYLHGLEGLQGNALQAATVNRWKFGFNDSSHPFIAALATAGSDTARLPGYNRMVKAQGDDLFAKYEVIDHHADPDRCLRQRRARRRAGGAPRHRRGGSNGPFFRVRGVAAP